MWDANLEKIGWIWNQCPAEDKARDCSWGGGKNREAFLDVDTLILYATFFD